MIRMDLTILAIVARMVPREERSEWLREWSGELWYLRQSAEPPCGPTRFCLGALRDAVSIRLHRPVGHVDLFRSPIVCLSVLATLAGAAFLVAMEWVSVKELIARQPMAVHAFLLGLALTILPVAASLSVSAQSLRGWLLFAAKVALVVPTVFFGIYDLAPIIGAMRPHATLIGYIVAFRWVLIDQRMRCPECLRRCGNPVSVGHPSYVLLDWYGTEFICPEGHGFLHVPQLPTSSFSLQRWLQLDSAVRSLFS